MHQLLIPKLNTFRTFRLLSDLGVKNAQNSAFLDTKSLHKIVHLKASLHHNQANVAEQQSHKTGSSIFKR